MRPAEQLATCLNLSAAEVPCETAPFASFSGRAEKGGPARPERGPISSSLVEAIDETIMHPISARGAWASTSGAMRLLYRVVEPEFDRMHSLNSRLFIQ